MKRGEVWTASGGGDYIGKPRPVLIVQDDRFDATASITIRAFTTDPAEAALFHLPVTPSDRNGLNEPCGLMIGQDQHYLEIKVWAPHRAYWG